MQNILIISPHPDDEVLGCGGAIAKYGKQGHAVHVCFVTKAYTPDWSEEFISNRIKEINRSNDILQIKKAHFLDLPTVKLDTIPQRDLNGALIKVIEQIQPDIVFIPHGGDLNKDHRLVHEASLVATRPYLKHQIKKILCYETLSETEWGVKEFKPNVYENIDGFVEIKLRAMQAYQSELKTFPHPRSREAISALAVKRGSEAGFKAAEAFMLVREVSV